MSDHTRTGATVSAVSSVSRKPVNQDAACAWVNTARGLTGVVVADGLGSHYGADVASARAATALASILCDLGPDSPLDLPGAFARVNAALTAHVEGLPDLPPDLDWNAAFGTTLLCAVDDGDAFTVAYAGNGAIFHVRGDFNACPATQLLPWSAVNVLSPHALSTRGRSTLYKFLGPGASVSQVMPTVVTISKDAEAFGDIVIVCTDGIASQDQTSIGLDDANQLWIKGDAGVAMLYDHLSRFFAAPRQTDDTLQVELERYLAALLARGLVSDDCTVGVIVSAAAARYQASRPAPERAEVPA